MLQERTLQCVSCGTEFPFSIEEQSFYLTKGFQDPKRCKTCRDAVKSQRQGGNRYGGGGGGYPRPERQLYDVQCSACGQMTQVPFRPKGDRPVYCRTCYADSYQGGY